MPRKRLYGWMPRAFCALALATFGATLGLPGRAHAQFPDTYSVTYYDVATSVSPSRAGYGGPGFSGGAGDNTVRVLNATAANGSLCAMIYVFDDFEELQTCCGCPITPDGLRTLSTINDLTSNFGVNKGNLNAGVIKLISSRENFTPGTDSATNPFPLGTDGCTREIHNGVLDPNCTITGNGVTPRACSPTGSASNDPRASVVVPTSGLRAWITHDELEEPGNVPHGSAVQGISVEEFQDSPLDSTELAGLQQSCFTLITNSSGAGFCTCGAGEPLAASGKTVKAKSVRRHR